MSDGRGDDLPLRVDVSLVLFRSPPDLLARTLKALLDQSYVNQTRILVNDADPAEVDRYRLIAAEVGLTDVAIHHCPGNLGFAGGHNRLLARSFAANATHALVLNPDLVLEPGAIERLLTLSSNMNECALVSGVLLLGDRDRPDARPQQIDSRGTLWTATCRHVDEDHGVDLRDVELDGEPRRTAAITGALILVPRQVHDRMVALTDEFFDEDFFAYREDAELGLRAKLLGIDCVVLNSPVGVHFRGSPGTTRTNPTANRLSARNRFLLAAKFSGRLRPGLPGLRNMRDLIVIAAAVTTQRDLLPAIEEAVALRKKMKAKRRRMLAARGAQARLLPARSSPPVYPAEKDLDRDIQATLDGVYVVIPLFSPEAAFVDYLHQLSRCVPVVLVDDGHTPAEIGPELPHGVTLLRNGGNQGQAFSLNRGVDASFRRGAEYVITLDQDSVLDFDGLCTLVAAAREYPDAGLLGPAAATGVRYAAVPWRTPRRPAAMAPSLQPVRQIIQSGMVISDDTWRREGPFDPDLFIDGVDTDYCLRVRKSGHDVLAVDGVTLQHQLGLAPRTLRIGPLEPTASGHSHVRWYYMVRNRLLLIRRHGRFDIKWALLTLRRTAMGLVMALTFEPGRFRKLAAALAGLGAASRAEFGAAPDARLGAGATE